MSKMWKSKDLAYSMLLVSIILTALWIGSATPGVRTAADDFMPARLFHDLFEAGGKWDDWTLPAAPYYFPDLSLYFALLFAKVPFEIMSQAYAYAISLLTAFVTWSISLRLYGDRLQAITTAIMLVAGLIIVGETWSYWNRPIFHYGVFFNGLVILSFALRGVDRVRYAIPVFFVVAMAVISDFLFIPVILSGMSGYLVAVLVAGTVRKSHVIAMAMAVGLGVAVGYELYFWLTPHAPGSPLWASGLHLRYGSLNPLSYWIGIEFAFDRLTSPYYGVLAGIALFSGFSIWRDRPSRDLFLAISGFFISAIVANIVVVGLDTYEGAFNRYSIFATNGSLAYGTFCVGFLLRRNSGRINGAILVLGVIAAYGVVNPEVSRNQATVEREVEISRCLVNLAEQQNLRYGLASYSNANRYSVLTGYRVDIRPVEGDSLDDLHWQRSSAWLNHIPEFVLASESVRQSIYREKRLAYPLSEEVVVREAGKPDIRRNCGELVVMIYRRGAANTGDAL